MKYLIVFFAALATVSGSVARIGQTDEAEIVPGRTVVRSAAGGEPASATDALPLLPGWPVKVSSHPTFGPARGVAFADFDGDGRHEVIRPSTGSQIHVWKYDGTYYPGWPKSLSGYGQYAAAVADVDLDGDYEVALSTRGMTSGGMCYLLSENGANEPGWPFSGLVGGNFSDAPTLVDIDGDDTLEVIVGERDHPIGHLHLLRYDGSEYSAAWPCSLDHVPAGGAAVADINCDGIKDIVYFSYNSIYVFQPDGSILAGWPRTMPDNRNFSYQSPALADLDDDDTLEIVVAMHKEGGGCYVWRHDGTLYPGWPYAFPRWTYCPPTVADLYRNGDLKVLCGLSGIMGGSAAVLYGFFDNGSVLPGFPYYQPNGDAAEGDITVADIDGDEDMEIIFSSNLMTSADSLGYLYAIHSNGVLVTGWPQRCFGFTYLNGATVADVDGDDSLDIIAVSAYESEMEVTIWEAGVPFSRRSWEWPTYQFDMERTGHYQWLPVGIEAGQESACGLGFRLAPNPARPGARLSVESEPGREAGLSLFDRSGRMVAELGRRFGPGRHELALPAGIPAGVYFLRLSQGREARSAKLVVQ